MWVVSVLEGVWGVWGVSSQDKGYEDRRTLYNNTPPKTNTNTNNNTPPKTNTNTNNNTPP